MTLRKMLAWFYLGSLVSTIVGLLVLLCIRHPDVGRTIVVFLGLMAGSVFLAGGLLWALEELSD
jgi:hypothetical protein